MITSSATAEYKVPSRETLEKVFMTRWLDTNEVFNILHHIDQLIENGFSVKTTPHERPPLSNYFYKANVF